MPKTYRKRNNRRKTNTTRAVRAVVRSELNKKIEMKEIDYTYDDVNGWSFADISYGTSAVVTRPLDGITQGAGDAQRIGTKITLKGLYFKMALRSKTTFANVRFLVVSPKGDKIDESTTAAFVQQLLSNTASSATQYLAPVDTDLYKVYFDKTLLLRQVPVDGSSSGVYSLTRNVYRFLKFNRPVRYVPGATTAFNQIFLIAISDDNTVLSYPGAVAGFVKVYYQDA